MTSKQLQNILGQDVYSKSEVNSLLQLSDKFSVSLLMNRADQVRKENCGDEIHMRGVIDISNNCNQNCNYCGLRSDNYALKRYRMEPDQILDVASKIAKLGIYTIVLKSGEDEQLDTDIIAYIIYSIKNSTDIAITLSLGERGFDEYKTWKIAGADRYILRHESCDNENFSIHNNKKTFLSRIQHLNYLKRLGYQIGTGSIIGLPSQSIEDITDDIFLMKELDVDMAFFSTFIPCRSTPYQNIASGSFELTLKAIATARLVLKNVHIPATMALDSLDIEGREKALQYGANIILPDFTPFPFREFYQVYTDRKDMQDDPLLASKNLLKRIEKLGRYVSFSRGDSLKNVTGVSH